MVKIVNTLLPFAGLCAALVRVGADVVIDQPIANPIPGVTPIVSASVVGASAIGIESDGLTRYVVTEVESFVGVASGSQTLTSLSVPTTLSFTFAEDASVYSASAANAVTIAGVTLSAEGNVRCTGTGNRGAVDCVEQLIASAGVAGTTFLTTLSTSFVATTSPIFTITGTQAVPTVTSTAKSAASHVTASMASTSILGFMSLAYVVCFSIF